jgi:hypothetical protein
MPWYNVILLPEVIKWLWSGVIKEYFSENAYTTVVVVIVWKLDLQLPMQSVPITTDIVSSVP